MNIISNCVICAKKLIGKQTKYCSDSCKNRDHQSYPSQKTRGIRRKMELIKRLGGACSACQYNENISALTFHHVREKHFQLDVRSLSNRTEKVINKEVNNCILLCHNCHAEIHNPDLALRSLSRLL